MGSVSTDNPEDGGRTDRWQSMVMGAFHLDETLGSKEVPVDGSGTAAHAQHYLETLLEVFPSSVDPLEDFEGYAVRRMLLSLRRALEHQGGH
ncbi:hypothetical protein Q664_13380 [Archangium violaceum Cb vi76]|uniref:Uncharacterized protein n=1 Tax=Archangium violaceum Cb vi76 TaxID=1406225 RepID=A0A084SWJ1_9BACT|nr:hypothetical protein Q664_13380 [Archangium violaceum Cb vi76]